MQPRAASSGADGRPAGQPGHKRSWSRAEAQPAQATVQQAPVPQQRTWADQPRPRKWQRTEAVPVAASSMSAPAAQPPSEQPLTADHLFGSAWAATLASNAKAAAKAAPISSEPQPRLPSSPQPKPQARSQWHLTRLGRNKLVGVVSGPKPKPSLGRSGSGLKRQASVKRSRLSVSSNPGSAAVKQPSGLVRSGQHQLRRQSSKLSATPRLTSAAKPRPVALPKLVRQGRYRLAVAAQSPVLKRLLTPRAALQGVCWSSAQFMPTCGCN